MTKIIKLKDNNDNDIYLEESYGYELFNGRSALTDDGITLSDDVSNYKYVDIYYSDSNYRTSFLRIDTSEISSYSLNFAIHKIADYRLVIIIANGSLSGNTLKLRPQISSVVSSAGYDIQSCSLTFDIVNKTISYSQSATIYIEKVIGYK